MSINNEKDIAFWWSYLDALNQSYKRAVTANELAHRLNNPRFPGRNHTPVTVAEVQAGLDAVVAANQATADGLNYTSKLWASEQRKSSKR